MCSSNQAEVAEVFRALKPRLSEFNLSPDQYQVIESIVSCRTARLGVYLNVCAGCGAKEQAYNSCWNRHCPKCQGGAAFQWVSDRSKELLPEAYFHLVFTLPHHFRRLIYSNKRICYDLLFKASSDTLLTVARNNCSIELGFFGVLHSWNQDLLYHPHLHYVVPAGGIHTESGQWEKTRKNNKKFFLPVRILSKVFRGKFIALLKKAYHRGELHLEGQLSHLKNPREFEHLISRAAAKDFNVYAKRPFHSAECVVKYLANYTHRVGISNKRILKVTDTHVTFSARHKTNSTKRRLITLTHEQFLRRFLLHVLPRAYRRIRYYGFLAPGRKKEALARIRTLLELQQPVLPKLSNDPLIFLCPKCLVMLALVLKPHRVRQQGGLTLFPNPQPPSEELCLSP